MNLRRLVLPATLGVVGYFALFGGEYNAFESWQLERRLADEQAELERLEAEVEALRARADSLETDPAMLERLARERYGMIREGERLYHFVEPEPVDSVRVSDSAPSGGGPAGPGAESAESGESPIGVEIDEADDAAGAGEGGREGGEDAAQPADSAEAGAPGDADRS